MASSALGGRGIADENEPEDLPVFLPYRGRGFVKATGVGMKGGKD
jgi:hypothetical protein